MENLLKTAFPKFLFTTVVYLPDQISGKTWDSSDTHLFEYNKNLITLSSSAFVLSFGFVKLAQISVNKVFLIFSWVMFLGVILSGSFLLLLNYLYRLNDSIMKRKSESKTYKTREEQLKSVELIFFFRSRGWMYWTVLSETVFFGLGFIALIFTAVFSI